QVVASPLERLARTASDFESLGGRGKPRDSGAMEVTGRIGQDWNPIPRPAPLYHREDVSHTTRAQMGASVLPPPHLPVQRAIVDRLGDVLLLDGFRSLQVGDSPGHAQDAVMGPGAQAQLIHR